MRPDDGRIVSNLIVQALSGAPMTIYGTGEQTRSFCYVSDLVDGLIRLAESGEHEPVNIGNPGEFTLLDLAQKVIDVTRSSSRIVYEALPVNDPQQRRPDITRARELLGWEPTIELDEGLRLLVERSSRESLTGRVVGA
jgi:dTDP-glucose 4,6-dehydratase